MVEYWARRNDPMARARERFASGDLVEEGVRAPILQSWQRCRDLGLRPDRFELPYDANLDLESPWSVRPCPSWTTSRRLSWTPR